MGTSGAVQTHKLCCPQTQAVLSYGCNLCLTSCQCQTSCVVHAAAVTAVLLQCVKYKMRGGTTWLGIWAGVLIVVLTYYEIKAAIM